MFSFYSSAASPDGLAQYTQKRPHITAPVYDEDRDDYDSEEFDIMHFSSLFTVCCLCKNLTAYLFRALIMTS